MRKACGYLRERGQQRTDSMHVLAAICTMNRLECVAETLRAAFNSLSVIVPDWPGAQVPADWYERYGTRTEEYRFLKEASKRQALTEQIGADGWALLSVVRSADAPTWVWEVPVVETLRRVWAQQFWVEGGVIGWRSEFEPHPRENMALTWHRSSVYTERRNVEFHPNMWLTTCGHMIQCQHRRIQGVCVSPIISVSRYNLVE